ncbi:MAG: hypothetical protein ACE5J5_02395 [Candidatus Hydrothermarchaeales archaeon]
MTKTIRIYNLLEERILPYASPDDHPIQLSIILPPEVLSYMGNTLIPAENVNDLHHPYILSLADLLPYSPEVQVNRLSTRAEKNTSTAHHKTS